MFAGYKFEGGTSGIRGGREAENAGKRRMKEELKPQHVEYLRMGYRASRIWNNLRMAIWELSRSGPN
jgi:hypothetical protein